MWLRIAFGLVTLYAVLVTYALFVRNPLPWPDKGGATFTTSSLEAFRAVVKLYRHFGWEPRYRLDSTGIKRAMFDDGFFVNYTDPALRATMGNPVGGKTFVVDDPVRAAQEGMEILAAFNPRKLPHFTDDVKPDDLVAIGSEAAPGQIFVFRKHMLKLGPRPPRWTED
ncbi:MAG TPA: hypothetical protein VJA27_00700 [Patescibacteria group bacterium]|nr:hypothetical protein [Patescibacteria group bacterium]